MKKTKIEFKDIKAGDLLEVVVKEFGVKSVMTGIAFHREFMETGVSRETVWWSTSEGGMIVNTDEDSEIWRIDVTKVKFEDVRIGDKIRVTSSRADADEVVTGVVHSLDEGEVWFTGWETEKGFILCTKQAVNEGRMVVEILEREGE